MKAYKTVLRDNDSYISINRFLNGEIFRWKLNVKVTSPGGKSHGDNLFAYSTIEKALNYATEHAPNGEVVCLECDVVGKDVCGKLFCNLITPIREIPIKRTNKPHRNFSDIAGGRAPIRYVSGNQSPTLEGESYCWMSSNGVVWRKNKAPEWPYYKTYTYYASTRKICVGKDWKPLEIDRDAVYSNDNH